MTNENYSKVAHISDKGEILLDNMMNLCCDQLSEGERKLVYDTIISIVRHERIDAICTFNDYMLH